MQKFTGKYFSRSWADLTHEKGWWKPMLILTLVQFIPIVGQMIAIGYMLDWAKEISWNVNRPFPRQMGDVGRRLKYGFFALVITIVWVVPVAVVSGILHAIPFLGGLLYFCCQIVALIAGVVSIVASLRALTYERISPGLQVSRILKMAQQDSAGLAKCWLITFVGGLIICLIALAFAGPMVIAAVAAGMSSGAFGGMDFGNFNGYYGNPYFEYGLSSGDYSMVYPIIAALAGSMPLFMVLGFVLGAIGTVVSTVAYRAYGYWLGQFVPSQWGRPEDPMPFERSQSAQSYGIPYGSQQFAGYAGQPSAAAGAGASEAAADAAAQAAEAAEADALYEEAKRSVDPAAQAAEWEREFVASQQEPQQPALNAGEEQTEAPQTAEPAEETAAESVETVGQVVAEETVGAMDEAQSVDSAADAEPKRYGWRSASNAEN